MSCHPVSVPLPWRGGISLREKLTFTSSSQTHCCLVLVTVTNRVIVGEVPLASVCAQDSRALPASRNSACKREGNPQEIHLWCPACWLDQAPLVQRRHFMAHLARIPATSLLLEVSGGTTHFCRHRSGRSIPPGSQEGSGPTGASAGRSGTSHRCCRCPTGWPRTDGTKDGSLKEAGNKGDRQHSWTKQSCYRETSMRTQGRYWGLHFQSPLLLSAAQGQGMDAKCYTPRCLQEG